MGVVCGLVADELGFVRDFADDSDVSVGVHLLRIEDVDARIPPDKASGMARSSDPELPDDAYVIGYLDHLPWPPLEAYGKLTEELGIEDLPSAANHEQVVYPPGQRRLIRIRGEPRIARPCDCPGITRPVLDDLKDRTGARGCVEVPSNDHQVLVVSLREDIPEELPRLERSDRKPISFIALVGEVGGHHIDIAIHTLECGAYHYPRLRKAYAHHLVLGLLRVDPVL